MMRLDFIRWRFHFIKRPFHYSNDIKHNQNDVIQNCISYETHNWSMYTIWEIETQNLWFTQMPFQGEMGGQKIFACLSAYGLFCRITWGQLVVIWWGHSVADGDWVGMTRGIWPLPFESVGQESVITESHFPGIYFQITHFTQIWQILSTG